MFMMHSESQVRKGKRNTFLLIPAHKYAKENECGSTNLPLVCWSKSQICKLKQLLKDLVSDLVTKGKKQTASVCFLERTF